MLNVAEQCQIFSQSPETFAVQQRHSYRCARGANAPMRLAMPWQGPHTTECGVAVTNFVYSYKMLCSRALLTSFFTVYHKQNLIPSWAPLKTARSLGSLYHRPIGLMLPSTSKRPLPECLARGKDSSATKTPSRN